MIVFEEPASYSRGRKRGREAARERERFLVQVLCVESGPQTILCDAHAICPYLFVYVSMSYL